MLLHIFKGTIATKPHLREHDIQNLDFAAWPSSEPTIIVQDPQLG